MFLGQIHCPYRELHFLSSARRLESSGPNTVPDLAVVVDEGVLASPFYRVHQRSNDFKNTPS